MAFNPNPKVKEARNIANKFEKKQVIVLMLDENTLEYASFGQTKQLCDEAKKIADVAYDAVMEFLKQ